MTKAEKIDTAFTTRLTMSMMSDTMAMIETVKRLALTVEAQAKEHGVALSAEFVDAVTPFRGAN